jgi:branched-subunit amino acid aminotransferase/4-amino-4-deoxychorismate lyase
LCGFGDRARGGVPLGATEKTFSLDDLALATEVFVTSTTREVQAVCEVIGVAKWDTAPGPITEAAQAAYTTARKGTR